MTFSFIFSLIDVLFIRLFTLHMFALIRLPVLSSGWPLISEVDRDDLLGLFALSTLRYPLDSLLHIDDRLHIEGCLHVGKLLGVLLSIWLSMGSLGGSLGIRRLGIGDWPSEVACCVPPAFGWRLPGACRRYWLLCAAARMHSADEAI